jgi:hypothetical protein
MRTTGIRSGLRLAWATRRWQMVFVVALVVAALEVGMLYTMVAGEGSNRGSSPPPSITTVGQPGGAETAPVVTQEAPAVDEQAPPGAETAPAVAGESPVVNEQPPPGAEAAPADAEEPPAVTTQPP